MKKILYTKFEGIDTILDSMLNTNKKSKIENELNQSAKELIKKAINRNTLYKFWKQVVGEKFAKLSYPHGMLPKYVMIISCKNATVAQELLLRKTNILEKLTPFTKSLNITVKDLKFDPKKWDNERIEQDN